MDDKKRYFVSYSKYSGDSEVVNVPQKDIVLGERLVVNGEDEFDRDIAIKYAKQIALVNYDSNFLKVGQQNLSFLPYKVSVIDSFPGKRHSILVIKRFKFKDPSYFDRCDLHDWLWAIDPNYQEIVEPIFVNKRNTLVNELHEYPREEKQHA